MSRVSEFIKVLVSLLNNILSSSRRRQVNQVTADDIKIISQSVKQLSNEQLEVAFFVRSSSGNVIMGDTVIQAVRSDEDSLAQSVSV